MDDSTDHSPTFVGLPKLISSTSIDNIKIGFRESKLRNVHLLSIRIQTVDWNEYFVGDADIDTEQFIHFLNKSYCACCPKRTTYICL